MLRISALLGVQFRQIDDLARTPPKQNLAADELGGRAGQQTQDRLGGHAFAAATFTNDAQRFAGLHIETDAIDCRHFALQRIKSHSQVFHLHNHICVIG